MPVNAGIALLGKPLDTTPGLEGLRRSVALNQQDRQFNQAHALDQEALNLRKEELAFNRAAKQAAALDERQKRRLQSSIVGAATILPYLEQGDKEGARNALISRKNILSQAMASGVDVDTAETDDALKMLDESPDELLSVARNSVKLGEQLGVLKPEGRSFEQELQLRKAGASKTNINLGKGEVERDKETAKAVSEFLDQGGAADAQKGLAQLNGVVQALESGRPLTGPVLGLMPDLVKNFTNPESVSVREAAEEVVQRNLRLILGAQFTEKEGERLIARAFNEKLGEKENAKRVKRLITQMQLAFDQKVAAAKYFDENGTMKGFQGHIPSLEDFEQIDFDTPQIQEGTVIVNPQTNERMIFRNGAWQPL